MGNNIKNLQTVVFEKDGWQLGHNENPDVNLDESEEFLLLNPSKTFVICGSRKTLEEHMSDDPEDVAWRGRHA